MTTIACFSLKGAPGVTTLAMGLAATWPTDRQALLVELDSSGGDLGARFGVSLDKSIVGFAAAGRHVSANVDEHVTVLPGGLNTLLASPSADQTRSAASVLISTWLPRASRGDLDLILDCGRIDSHSPALAALPHTSIALLCVHPALSDVTHALAAATLLRSKAQNLALVLIGNGVYTDSEVATALDLSVVARLPHDVSGASILGGGRGSARALGRSPLVQACKSLGDTLRALESSGEVVEEIEAVS